MATLEDFLKRVIDWPDPDPEKEGWVNLHWRGQNKDRVTGGQAFKTLGEVLGFLRWSQSSGKGKIADIYFCTSLQKEHGELKPNGKYGAKRAISNAVCSKILFADIDKYGSKVAALLALETFCKSSVSPFPTALVDSGGGVHAYWVLPEALPPEQWLALAAKFDGLMNAHGLKHDNVSTDMARILRPPETHNHKRVDADNPNPTPVKLLKLDPHDVDIGAWKSLHEAEPTAALTRTPSSFSVPLEQILLDPKAMTGKKPSKLFAAQIPLDDEVSGTVDPAPVIKFCPMFRETLATGGKEVGQPVWHQQALAATFLAGGHELFHDLGRQHVGYSRESTDEMYHRKVRDRVNKGLGYPSCAAFEADGAPQCKTCPWRNKVQSPLNLNAKSELEATPTPPPSDLPQATETPEEPSEKLPPLSDTRFPDGAPWWAEYMPPGFAIDADGFVTATIGSGKNAAPERLFDNKILHVETFKDAVGRAKGLYLSMTGALDEEPYPVLLDPNDFRDTQGTAIYASLNKQGVMGLGHSQKTMELMSTMRGRLAREKGAPRIVPFGWEYKDRGENEEGQGEPIGFAFGGQVYSAGGKTRKTYGGDVKLMDTYGVTGKPDPWANALRVILRMNSPGLQAVVLSAFAAPLMIFTGQPSTVVMVRGQSGGSKSTASSVAAAVWARPRTAMLKPSSSKLGVMKRMGRIRHLPTVWDDIRNEQFETVKDTLMEITQGGEGLKLDSERNEREQGIWDNMLLTSSNNSLVEYLEEISKNDGAALVRCFEFEVPKVTSKDKAYQDPHQVATLIASLDFNHGHAGNQYATLLGFDPDGIRKTYDLIAKRFSQRIAPYQPHERFWMAAAASMLTGGMIANTLPIMKSHGITFNLDAVEEFLVEIYLELRRRHAEANVHADTSQYVKNWLSAFFNNFAAVQNEVVWTFDAPAGRGKPLAQPPIWPISDQARNMKKVSVRWQKKERVVKIAKTALDKYLRQEKTSVDRIRQGLVQFYGARVVYRANMAAGLNHVSAQGPETIYEIDIKPGTWLDSLLLLHANDVGHNSGQPPPEQSPRPQETRPLPEREGPEDEKVAS